MSARRSQLNAGLAARGAVRGLVNPWFATATGVMIAASLWVYYPHAQFKLPASSLGRTSCNVAGCGQRNGKSSLATSGGQQLPRPKAGKRHGHHSQQTDAGTSARSPQATVEYTVLYQYQGMEQILITVPRRAGQNWTLSLSMPGDHIVSVRNAHWQPSGSGGGIASALNGGTQGQPGGDGGSGWWPQREGQPLDTFQFLVVAGGQQTAPAVCVLDGARCTFRSWASISGH